MGDRNGDKHTQKSNARRMGDRNSDKHTQKKETKNKCENCRGITLLPTAYKLFANIIKKNRLNEHVEDEMVEGQCGFRKGRSCTDAIFTVQQITEKKERTQLIAISFIYRL